MISERSRRTISSIYDAALAPNLWPAALQSAMDEVGAVGAGYSVFNKRTERVEWLSQSGSLVGREGDYFSYYHELDRYSRPFRLGDGCGFPSACPKPYSVATNTRHVSGLDTSRHISDSVFLRISAAFIDIPSFLGGSSIAPYQIFYSPTPIFSSGKSITES